MFLFVYILQYFYLKLVLSLSGRKSSKITTLVKCKIVIVIIMCYYSNGYMVQFVQ